MIIGARLLKDECYDNIIPIERYEEIITDNIFAGVGEELKKFITVDKREVGYYTDKEHTEYTVRLWAEDMKNLSVILEKIKYIVNDTEKYYDIRRLILGEYKDVELSNNRK